MNISRTIYIVVLTLIACYLYALPSHAQTTTQVFCSNDPNLPVPILDNATVTSTLTVPNPGEITDVKLLLQINHTWIGDLSVDLESPGLTKPTLIPFLVCGNCDNFGVNGSCPNPDFILDDDAVLSVTTYPGLIADTLSPFPDPLSMFDAEQQDGLWTLSVSDNAGGDQGFLNCWCLEITREVKVAMVPTLSEWGLIAMAGLLGIIGFIVIRRKQLTA